MEYIIIAVAIGIAVWLFYKIRQNGLPSIEDTNPYMQTRKTDYDKVRKIKEERL